MTRRYGKFFFLQICLLEKVNFFTESSLNKFRATHMFCEYLKLSKMSDLGAALRKTCARLRRLLAVQKEDIGEAELRVIGVESHNLGFRFFINLVK